jgi:NADH-quinone oxidoreductase subunit L
MEVVLGVGLTTALVAGVIGLAQSDIKKVLAYSTISQLGFMFVALGSGAVGVAIFHLVTHAFFKATLFLGAGSVIHMTEEQDARQLGGLWWRMPVTAATFIISALALAGIAPLSGFFSKDEIFSAVEKTQDESILILLGLAAFLSALYMTRLVIITFFGAPKNLAVIRRAREAPPAMLIPLVFLTLLTLLVGFFAMDQVGDAFGFPGGINNFVYFPEPEDFGFNNALAVGTGLVSALGIFTGYWFFWGQNARRAEALREFQPRLAAVVENKFYFDEAYQWGIDHVVLPLGGKIAWFDRFIINDTIINGPADLTRYGGYWLKYHVTGRLPDYALFMILGIVGAGALGLLLRVG